MKKIELSDVLGAAFIVLLVIGMCWYHYHDDNQPEHSSTVQTITVPTPQYPSPTKENQNDTTTQKTIDLQSLIEACEITFDENFRPVATIKLHNITGKRIDQIQFRFTFTNYERMNNAQIGLIEDGENSSYLNREIMLTPPDYKTITVKIPNPKRKNIEKPNVYVTKIRYYDGTVQTDNR